MARTSDRDGKPRPEPVDPSAGAVHRVDAEAIVAEKERHWSGRLKKPAEESKLPSPGQEAALDTGFSQDFPALVAFITHRKWEDGSPRAPGSFLMFVQDGMLTACVTDKALHRKAFVAARTAQDLLSRVEEGIRQDDLPWRPEADGKGRGR